MVDSPGMLFPRPRTPGSSIRGRGMTWERQLSTPETENVVLDGTTLRVYSGKSQIEAVVVCDLTSSRLQVSMRSGDYVYVSEWLDVSPLYPAVGMVQDIRQDLERWLLLVSQPYTRQTSSWPPLELISLLYRQIERVLA